MTKPTFETTLKPWTVTASRYVVQDRWLTVRADDCVTSDGVTVAPYFVLEYPDWVHVVALDGQGRICLIEQYRHGLGVMSLELPGGVMDATDNGPLETAARELAEETGGTAAKLTLIASLSANPANQTNHVHFVLAEGVTFGGAQALDESEQLVVRFEPVADVVRRAMAGEIIQSMHVAALAMALTSIGKWSI